MNVIFWIRVYVSHSRRYRCGVVMTGHSLATRLLIFYINGREVALKRTSKKPGKPTNFIGSFAGNGIRVVINNPRLVGKEYHEGEPKTEDNILSAVYKVDVSVIKGGLTKTFKNMIFSYGL